MVLAKLVFCGVLAIGSMILFRVALNKPWESRLFRSTIILAIALKFILCIAVYTNYPDINKTSDDAQHYYPQALRFMAGEMPYRDFPSSYSILFLPLVSLAISVWDSVGAIAFLMLLFEAGMVGLYLRRCRLRGFAGGYRAVFLYVLSPISFYWVTFGGYNGPIIAFFTMAGLIAAENERQYLSGLLAALGLLCSKLLAVLGWPAVIIYGSEGIFRRSLPLILLGVFHLAALAFGIDMLLPLKNEIGRHSSGNLWFVLSIVAPTISGGLAWNMIPLPIFAACFSLIVVAAIQRRALWQPDRFNSAMALTAAIFLLFMLISRKTYTMYLPMMLIFITHTLAADGRFSTVRLVALAYLGTAAVVEPLLISAIVKEGATIAPLGILGIMAIDIPIIIIYAYLLAICLRHILRPEVDPVIFKPLS